ATLWTTHSNSEFVIKRVQFGIRVRTCTRRSRGEQPSAPASLALAGSGTVAAGSIAACDFVGDGSNLTASVAVPTPSVALQNSRVVAVGTIVHGIPLLGTALYSNMNLTR